MRNAKDKLGQVIDDILLTCSIPTLEDINTLAKECFEETPSLGAWDLAVVYVTEGMESNLFIQSFVELFMKEILLLSNRQRDIDNP